MEDADFIADGTVSAPVNTATARSPSDDRGSDDIHCGATGATGWSRVWCGISYGTDRSRHNASMATAKVWLGGLRRFGTSPV